MKLQMVHLDEAAGKLLGHNIVDRNGQKVLRKGTPIGAREIVRLRELGHTRVWVALLEPDDVHEDEVARRLAELVGGEGTEIASLSTGRANLRATVNGILKVNTGALAGLNSIAGIAVATRPNNTLTTAGQIISTIKIVPYALPSAAMATAEQAVRDAHGILSLRALKAMNVGIVLTGEKPSEARVRKVYVTAIRERVEAWGSRVLDAVLVPEEVDAIAKAIRCLVERDADMVLIAGETSIVDVDDITPRGVRAAGAEIEVYGVPVDPGNLLMLAYLRDMPVVGVPGCVRSRTTNVVDLVLPRLLTGEHLTRADLIELGHGGLLA